MARLDEIRIGSRWMVDTTVGFRPVEVIGLEAGPVSGAARVRFIDLLDGERYGIAPGYFRQELEETVVDGERFLHPKGARLFKLPGVKDGAL